MGFLEIVGLLTVAYFGFIWLGELAEQYKENERSIELSRRENAEALVRSQKEKENKLARDKEIESIDKAIIQKQKKFKQKWTNIDPEEEYLIRTGKLKSELFDPNQYNSLFSPWESKVRQENHLFDPSKRHLLIKVEDLVENYGIPIKMLELLYKSYINEYNNDSREFTEEEMMIENLVSKSFLSQTPAEKAKSNVHQITLHKIVNTLQELKQLGIERNKTPVYLQE